MSTTDPVVSVSDDDPEMAAASAEARRRWPEFTSAFRDRAGEKFAAKFPFATKEPGHLEFMWLSIKEIDGDRVTGTLDSEPRNDVGYKAGDLVTVSSRDVDDWVYASNGAPIGGFTIKVLLRRQKH